MKTDFKEAIDHGKAAFAEFTAFFLRTCIDQATFMERLVRPDRLRERIRLWVEEKVRIDGLSPKSGNVLEAVLFRGELPRGDPRLRYRQLRAYLPPAARSPP